MKRRGRGRAVLADGGSEGTVGDLAHRLARRAVDQVDPEAIANEVEARVVEALAVRRGSVTGTEREVARQAAELAAQRALLAVGEALA